MQGLDFWMSVRVAAVRVAADNGAVRVPSVVRVGCRQVKLTRED